MNLEEFYARHNSRYSVRLIVAILFLIFSTAYFTWRSTVFNPEAWGFSIIFFAAEIFGLIITLFTLFITWRVKERRPIKPEPNLKVDVFIPTYNESVDIVRLTALAVKNIRYPHGTWILDDGKRSDIKQLAEELGCKYLTREDNSHAKAGNLNNALKYSEADFIALFDADHGPESTSTSFTFRDGPFRRERAAWTMAIYNTVHLYDIAINALSEQLVPPNLDETIRYYAFHQIEIDVHMEQLPNHDNGITLDWSKRDSAGQPSMRFYFSYGDYEKAGFEFSREIFLKSAKALNALDAKISEPYSHHHLMGMTRMGNDPETSVVDSECRSHEHPNLFIASSSVFPTATTANPTLTIAALSLRLADYLKSVIQSENL